MAQQYYWKRKCACYSMHAIF